MSRSVCIGYFSKPEVDLEIGRHETRLKPSV
jgi:hypothetical protein